MVARPEVVQLTGTASEAGAQPATPMVWSLTNPSGSPAGLVSFGSTAATLLAGFSMSAAVTLSGRGIEQRGLRGDIAIGLFAAAAAVLIFAIQSALTAATYQTSPTDRMASMPQACQDDAWLLHMRSQQWSESRIADRYRRSTRVAFNTGIVLFLSALTAALLPEPGGWAWPRTIAVIITVAAAVLEVLLWTRWPRRLVNHLMPLPDYEEQLSTKERNSEMPEISRQELRLILYGDAAPADFGDSVTVPSPQVRELLLKRPRRTERRQLVATASFVPVGSRRAWP